MINFEHAIASWVGNDIIKVNQNDKKMGNDGLTVKLADQLSHDLGSYNIETSPLDWLL